MTDFETNLNYSQERSKIEYKHNYRLSIKKAIKKKKGKIVCIPKDVNYSLIAAKELVEGSEKEVKILCTSTFAYCLFSDYSFCIACEDLMNCGKPIKLLMTDEKPYEKPHLFHFLETYEYFKEYQYKIIPQDLSKNIKSNYILFDKSSYLKIDNDLKGIVSLGDKKTVRQYEKIFDNYWYNI